MVMISGIVCIYYNVIIAWTLYYIYQSSSVSWATCGNWWNTPKCAESTNAVHSNISDSNLTSSQVIDGSFISNSTLGLRTSSEEFWL